MLRVITKEVNVVKITVAIPTFNSLEYLNQTVRSIFAQEHGNDINLYIFISNISSTNGRRRYLHQLEEDHENCVIYNKQEDN